MTYEELLKKARETYESKDTPHVVRAWLLANIIGPADESEDEKTRKELIEQVAYITPNNDELDDELNTLPTYQKRIDKYRAWLEKQGKKDPCVGCTCENGNLKEIEVEPKFKVGDWVVFIASESIYRVEKIRNHEYTLRHILGGLLCLSFSNEELIREWTITDAKDGDILVCNKEILLFKSSSKQGFISLYCWYNGQTNNFHGRGTDLKLRQEANIHPATKEQCNLLFQKMKEAGWEWDTEKKELKKIEVASEDEQLKRKGGKN